MSAALVMPTGIEIPTLDPGTPAWLKRMSASKVAAVLGLSPYESRFALWHRMAGALEQTPDTDATRRGHYLEPGIVDWFRDQHPDWSVSRSGTWMHTDREWQTATPDRLVEKTDGSLALLEVKTAADADGWGQPGTDEIPVGYRAQVMWQLDTVGLEVCHVAVLSAYLELNEYEVRYDADEAGWIRQQARAFLDSLPAGSSPQRPSLDAHAATYQAVRDLHPDIDPVDVEIPPELAARYRTALADAKTAEDEKREATATVADAIGRGRRAVCLGERIALRIPGRGGKPPFLRPEPLPKQPATILPRSA